MVEAPTSQGYKFRTIVEIGGLPYIFKGNYPIGKQKFDWKLYTPDMENYTHSRDSAFFDNSANEDEYGFQHCAAGFVRVEPDKEDTGLHLVHIRSNTLLLAASHPYYNARGIGNFLLKSVLKHADNQGKPVYLTACPDEDGRLGMNEATEWYERNGFQRLMAPLFYRNRPMARPFYGS